MAEWYELIPEITIGSFLFAFIVISLIVAGFFVWWFMARLKHKVDYEGRKIGRVRITIQNKYTLEGNLSHNDSFDDEILDQLQSQAEVKVAKGSIEQLKKEKKLFTYNLKITDDTEATDEFADKVRIISPVKIESDEYSWLDQRPKRPFSNPMIPESRINTIFVDSTQKITIYDEDQHTVDYWIASVLPASEAKMYQTLRDNPFPDAPVNVFLSEVIHQAKGLAEFHVIAKTFAKAIEFNKFLEKDRDTWKELYRGLIEKYQDKNIELNETDEELAQKPYIETNRDLYKKQQNVGVIWLVMCGIASGFGAMMFPSMFPSVDLQMAQFAGIILGLIIIGSGYMYYMSRQSTQERITHKEIEE